MENNCNPPEETTQQIRETEPRIQEEAEEFRVFKETTQDGFMLLNDRGKVLDVNKAYSRMTGFSEEELKKMTITDLEAKETPWETTEHIERVIKKGHDFFQSQHRKKNGRSFDVEISISFWKAKNQFFAYVRDISARVKEEQELEKLRQNLEKMVTQRTKDLGFALEAAKNANRVKNQFLSKMSHEFRTPLNAIIGFSQLLEGDDCFEGNENSKTEAKDHVQEILKAGRHLLTLVDTILDFSAINNTLLDLDIQSLDCSPLIRECIQEMKLKAAEKNITFETALEDGCMVLADKERLRQVLFSLLSNAVQYNREDGRIKVECSPAGECGKITVEDTGTGIPREYHDSIFEPFQNVGKEYGASSGAGIGLAMAKQLVEEMGGYIGMSSQLGRGSSFWLELPFTNTNTCL